MDAYKKTSLSSNDWAGLSVMTYFKERIAYDANGNILKYLRNGHKATSVMDSLTYGYNNGTNQLNWIRDQVPAATYGTVAGDVPDIDNQGANNYTYDEMGNLNSDNAEGITSINWSVYGKILEIDKVASAGNPVTRMRFTYDAQGNRISKVVDKNNGISTCTWYVRDAQGNVLTTYSSSGSGTDLSALPLQLTERHLYGSSRLGMYSQTLSVDNGPADMSDSNGTRYFRGYRQYELTNHLGNVLATISDKKKPVYAAGLVSYYDADVTTAQDYYPFGMQMPGRIGYQTQGGWVSAPGSGSDNSVPADLSVSLRNNNLPPEYTASNSIELTPGFESGTGDVFNAYITAAIAGGAGSGTDGSSLNGAYRYGFNGKENDNEIKGSGNQYNYGFRIYDPRIGRFLTTDPLTISYPQLTPYQFSSNNPIRYIDLDGAEATDPFIRWFATDAALSIANHPNSAKAKIYSAGLGVAGSANNVIVGVGNTISHPVEAVKALSKAVVGGPQNLAINYAANLSEQYSDLPIELQDFAIKSHVVTDIGIMLLPFKSKTSSVTKSTYVNVAENIKLPSRLVRVIEQQYVNSTTLGAPGNTNVFVTDASQLKGLTTSEAIAKKLTLVDKNHKLIKGSFRLIEFDTPSEGLAQPIRRNNPVFIGGGQTAGGATEYVVPNSKISSLGNVKQTTVK